MDPRVRTEILTTNLLAEGLNPPAQGLEADFELGSSRGLSKGAQVPLTTSFRSKNASESARSSDAPEDSRSSLLPRLNPLHHRSWPQSLTALEKDQVPITQGDIRDLVASITTDLRGELFNEQRRLIGEAVTGLGRAEPRGFSSKAKVKTPKSYANPKLSGDVQGFFNSLDDYLSLDIEDLPDAKKVTIAQSYLEGDARLFGDAGKANFRAYHL
jgi:hypothetical protein